jgi:hypothetical protein
MSTLQWAWPPMMRKIVLDCFGASPAFVAGHFFPSLLRFAILARVEFVDQITEDDSAFAGHQ